MTERNKYYMKKKLLAAVLCICMVLSVSLTAFAQETDGTASSDSGDTSYEEQTPYLALGADLSDSQLETVLKFMNLTKEDLDDYQVVTVTNQEEHEYLDDYLDSSVIGTHALSSVLITQNDPGEGITITTYNINYCTVAMYQNALITAGLEDANIIVAGPFEISGTAALIGAVKAYSNMTGEEVDEDSLDTAVEELVTTGDIAEEVGETEEIADLMAYIKQTVIQQGLTSQSDIEAAIQQAAEEFGVELTQEQIDRISSLMQKISGLDIDTDALMNQAKDIFNKLEGMGLDLDSAQVKGFFGKLIDAILAFFESLFG
jgi:uncharacterized protein YpuA (DUF1002 family)